jgi:hypothetical protein
LAGVIGIDPPYQSAAIEIRNGTIMAGERNPYLLASFRDPNVKASEEEIPRNRETRDRENQLVSTGNTLAALLLCADERQSPQAAREYSLLA